MKLEMMIDQLTGVDLNIRDDGFRCYYYIKNNEYEKAIAFIEGVAKKIEEDDFEYNDVVFWLWTMGEYINVTKEYKRLEHFNTIIQKGLDYIVSEWKKPRANWIGNLEEGIYLSNIAMSYGAMQSINNVIRNEKAQKLILDMKAFLFEKYLDKGKVVSRLGDKEILGDISVIAVPFALMDAGNQILRESINCIENELMEDGVRLSARDTYFGGCARSDLTCLLSWYYSERGDMASAKTLLQQVKEAWERDGKLFDVDTKTAKEEVYYNHYIESDTSIKESFLSYSLYAIASLNISMKEQGESKESEVVKIRHSVEGSGNKYLREHTERFPNHPIKDEHVILKMVTQPFNRLQKAYVQYLVNGINQEKIEMTVESSSEGEKYFEVVIGHFDFDDHVKYHFIVETEKTQDTSKNFGFVVRGWQSIGDISAVTNDSEGMRLFFLPLFAGTYRPVINLKKQADTTLKWSFCMEEELVDVESSEREQVKSDMKINGSHINIDVQDFSINIGDAIRGDILNAYKRHGEDFIELLTDHSGRVYKVKYKFLINDNEKFYGMGERYAQIEYTGLEVDNYVYNEYTGQGMRTYLPVPLAVSSKGYGIYIDTTMYSVFRFGTKLTDLLEVEVDLHKGKQTLDTYIFVGTPKEVIQGFVTITGKPKLPPKWAFGLWMSSNNWDSQAETLKQVALGKKYQIAATALVLEQWSDEATFYIFNDARYEVKDGNRYLTYDEYEFPKWGRWPNPKKMVDDLHNEGIKLLLWQAPVQKFMDGIAHAQRDEDERVMLEKGYHVKHKDGTPYKVPSYEWFKGSLIPDFSNEEAKEWWLSKRLYLTKEMGIDGFKSDGGECIYGEDLLFHDGRSGDEMRNQYPNDYIKCYHDFANEYADDGGLTFSRAGYTGAQNIPLHWAGDEKSTFEAYRASLNAGLSCGMSGIPFWGWDLGGFHGEIPTAELFIRSTQMAAFCPIMQYHAETKGELNRDRTPWNIAQRTGRPDVIDIFKNYVDLRMNLLPYIYNEAILSSLTGIPMMRAMFLEYPDDKSLRKLTGQYMFGRNLLIAPVLEENSYTKDVYLPEGQWMDLFSKEEFIGSRYMSVRADIGKIPVYVKGNTITPMNLTNHYKTSDYVGNELKGYQNLSFMVYVKENVEFDFSDDLGNHFSLSVSLKNSNVTFDIKGVIQQPITLIVCHYTNVVEVIVGGNRIYQVENIVDLAINTYCTYHGDLIIKIKDKATYCKIIKNDKMN